MKSTSTLFALLLLTLTAAFGQTRYYVAVGGTGSGTGSWSNASGNLAAIMSNAVPNSEIWIKQGTYKPVVCSGTCTDGDRATSFLLKANVRVIGGFTGNETSAAAANPANTTTLSGDIGVVGDKNDNSYNVLFGNQIGTLSEVTNLRITGGYANQATQGDISGRGKAGAGVYLTGNGPGGNSSPRFTSCTIVGNDAVGRGGGVFVYGGFGGQASPKFASCVLQNNTATAGGGGLFLSALGGNSDMTFVDTRIESNGTITRGSIGAGPGGGLYLEAQDEARGAQPARESSLNVTIDRCLFTGNYNDVQTPNNPGSRNNSNAYGGAIYTQTPTVDKLYNADAIVTIRNTVISKNFGYSGGGIYNLSSRLNLVNVTVTDNEARGSGGSGAGVYVNKGSAGIVNSLSYDNRVVFNTTTTTDFKFVNADSVRISYTLVAAADEQAIRNMRNDNDGPVSVLFFGPGNIYGQDPRFATSGATVPELTTGSPARNTGRNEEAFTQGGDYKRANRIEDGAVDLGAVEFGAAPLPVELISFTAVAEGVSVQLAWRTASEIDLEGYHVLRSTDGAYFSEVTGVPAMGSGDYSYTDRAVVAGQTYYYRLISKDFDGTLYDSDVVAVTLGADAQTGRLLSANVYPNPSRGEINLDLAPREGARTVYASVVDFTGRTLKLWPLTTDGQHSLDLGELPDGNYVLRLREGQREESSAIILQH